MKYIYTIILSILFICYPVFSQTPGGFNLPTVKQPSSSDISRIKIDTSPIRSLDTYEPQYNKNISEISDPAIPQDSDKIEFTLNDIKIIGSTVFSDTVLRGYYAQYIHKKISLDDIYKIAQNITEKYQQSGYFSSVAFVPQQDIAGGIIQLQIIESYIQDVLLPKDISSDSVINGYIQKLKQQKPIKAAQIESFLLRLNDLSGYNVAGTLSIPKNGSAGALILSLNNTPTQDNMQLSFDNHLSKFLGVHQFVTTYSTSFAPRHKTTFSGIKSVAFNRLTHLSLGHEFTILPKIKFNFSGSHTHSVPGLNLDALDLQSDSRFLGFGIDYQAIRQRNENLNLKFSIDSRDTNTDLKAFDFPFIRDKIRALRLNANYNYIDTWNGGTFIETTLSQGLSALGASKKNSEQISRAQAVPNFKKLELSVTRIQTITDNWSFVATSSGQIASDPLFSAEEFGYGGQVFGRAFDASEVTGDHGLVTSFELKYYGLKNRGIFSFYPYMFYDIGRLWNEDTAQVRRESASSTGFGVRISNNFGLNANASLAMPLIRTVQTPIYGGGNNEPRISFQLLQNF